ncbi:MAG: LamG-like jellyroll fold domain-containing protein, partial [Saprospiraceae bacterium]
ITYIIEKGTKATIFCTAEDKDSEVLKYTWYSDNGIITGNGDEVELTAPQNIGQTEVKVIVSDPEGNSDSLSIMLDIVNVINRAPIIHSLSANTNVVSSDASLQVVCDASDPNGDAITYTWTAAQGLISGQGAQVQWTAPQSEGVYEIKVRVADNQGLSVEKTISILVKNFDGNGDLIAWYPFSGNTQDLSGNNHHGTNKGGLLTTDFNGNANNAYYFNGGSQHIEVTSTTKLNTTEAISVSLWCKPAFGEEKEIFLLSHGSWQNRWKLSITPTRNVRWTVNTSTRIVDLDVTRPLISDSVYHIVASYDGKNMLIYVNGKLESFTNQTGAIKTTSLPMLIGQMLPTDAQYNFKGVIDDVRIYNFALSPNVVATLYNQGVSDLADTQQLDDIQILPNPANQFLTIKSTEFDQFSEIVIADLSGKNIQSLYNWNIENPLDVSQLKSGIYFLTIRQGSYSKSIQFLKI